MQRRSIGAVGSKLPVLLQGAFFAFADASPRQPLLALQAAARRVRPDAPPGGPRGPQAIVANMQVLLDLPEKNPNCYLELELELGSPQTSASILVRSSETADRGYRFFLGPAQKKIAILGFNYSSDRKILNDKEYAFSGTDSVSVQIFVCDDNMEASVDGQECLSARVVDRTCCELAMEIAGGGATIRNPFLHHFKGR